MESNDEAARAAAAPLPAAAKECVQVAVNIRPLIGAELLPGCTDCISVVPGQPQEGQPQKQEGQSQLLRKRKKSEEAPRRLQEEIQRIKSQKHNIKQESEQFRACNASTKKEVFQLQKEGRRNAYEMHKLLALNQRQKMVVQRKTEEAALATKRLKEVKEVKKPSRDLSGFRTKSGPDIQALMQAIEHQLEVRVEEHGVRSAYERQMEWRAAWASELAKLTEEAEKLKLKNLSECPQAMSPSTRNSRISALEAMLSSSSSSTISMPSQLSEAEDRERVLSSRDRWNQVSSGAEAMTIMDYLFNLVSSARCELRDKEVSCKEQDSEISEQMEKCLKLSSLIKQKDARHVSETSKLKEKCLKLSSLIKQKDAWLSEIREENEKIIAAKQHLAAKKHSRATSYSTMTQPTCSGEDDRPYGLRKPK